MSELRFKVGDEVEIGVTTRDGDEDTAWRGDTHAAWRRAKVTGTAHGPYPYVVEWSDSDGESRMSAACEEHMRLISKANEPRVTEAVAAVTVEPECRCTSYWNHDPGCAYVKWNQARRKRLG